MEDKKLKTTCLECGTEITLDFTGLNYEGALKAIDKIDQQHRECPGWHVEFGGWKKMWQLEDVVNRAYSDEEKAQAKEVVANIEIWIDGKRKHSVPNEEKLSDYLRGYRETCSEDQPLVVKYLNFAKELVDEYVGTVLTTIIAR